MVKTEAPAYAKAAGNSYSFTFRWRASPRLYVHTGDAREFRVISCDCCRSTKDPALKSAQLAKVVPYSFETPLSAALRTITLSPRFSVPTLED